MTVNMYSPQARTSAGGATSLLTLSTMFLIKILTVGLTSPLLGYLTILKSNYSTLRFLGYKSICLKIRPPKKHCLVPHIP